MSGIRFSTSTPADQVTCEGTEKALLDNTAGLWILFLTCMIDKEVFQGNSIQITEVM